MKDLKILILIISFSIISPVLFAQEENNPEDEDFDSLFESDSIEVEGNSDEEAETADEFLEGERMRWGGRLEASFESKWKYYDILPKFRDLNNPDEVSFTPDFGAIMYFDAKPNKNFRVFGKFEASYPFTSMEDYTIYELFSDFNWKERLFFRLGKQKIKWGVGYFFSPADTINLTTIDPENVDAEKEGPLAFKTQFSFSKHNLYFYIIADDITRPDELAYAPKIEFVVGPVETGIGFYFKKNSAPRGIVTLTIPVFEIDFFGELALSYGSDRNFVHSNGTSYKQKKRAFCSTTLGLSYFNTDLDLYIVGQYYYNGEGYRNSDKYSTALALMGMNRINLKDVSFFGRHYGAFSINWDKIFESDVGISLYWIGNFNDGSGQVLPSFDWDPFKHVTLSLSFPFFYGEVMDEFTPQGKNFSIAIKALLRNGNF